MRFAYYPGCTVKTKGKYLETAGIASAMALGVHLEELADWTCCGVVFSLADDDFIHHIAPVRNLIRAKKGNWEKLVTLCSMCNNTLARANLLIRKDKRKRERINLFIDDEIDYFGEVKVIHFLSLLRDEVGWEKIRDAVKKTLRGINVVPYYGCTLQRPREISIDPPGKLLLMRELLESIGATVLAFPEADLCCGSYQILANPEACMETSTRVLNGAIKRGADALVVSCPLCDFNLGRNQEVLLQQRKISKPMPVLYFTQLLAAALGISQEIYGFDLNKLTISSF